jgi:hypothetical protein
MAITTAGNVGIGTTGPNQKLAVSQSNSSTNMFGTNEDFALINSNGTNNTWSGMGFHGTGNGSIAAGLAAQYYDTTNSYASLNFFTRSANGWQNGLTINSGNVGIGTTGPENSLHVYKGSAGSVTALSTAPLVVENSGDTLINLLSPDANARGIAFGQASNNIRGSIIYNSSAVSDGFDFRAGAASSPQMVLTTAGNVGIGTTSPGAKLDVNGGGFLLSTDGQAILSAAGTTYFKPVSTLTNSDQYLQVTPLGSNTVTGLKLHGQVSASVGTRLDLLQSGANTIIRNQTLGGGSQGYISLEQNGDTRLRIDTAGNVGIGTTTPGTLFEIGTSDLGNGNAGPVITLGRNNNGTNTGAGSINFMQKGGTAGYVWQDAAGNMRIHTAAPSNANDTAGTVIGTQTSTRETKQDITDYTDYNTALNTILSAPLHTFRYVKEVEGYGYDSPLAKPRIGFIADEVDPSFMWGNVIDQVSVNGLLMASIKELDLRIKDLKNLDEFTASVIHVIDKLCIGQTCVTEDQLKTLLQNVNNTGSVVNNGGGSSTATPSFDNSQDTPLDLGENDSNNDDVSTPPSEVGVPEGGGSDQPAL